MCRDSSEGVESSSSQSTTPHVFISQKVFITLFCKNQLPHKYVNSSFLYYTITDMKNKMTDL